MHRLRNRLFLQVGLIILLFAVAMVVVNATCLERYYVWREKSMLSEQAAAIDGMAISDYSQVALQLEEIEKTRGVFVLVFAPDGSRLYSTSFLPGMGARPDEQPPAERQPMPGGQPPTHELTFPVIEQQTLSDGSSFQVQQDSRMNVSYLIYRRILTNGDTLELRVLQNSLRQSVAIANRFLIAIGGLVLLLALAWAFRFARKFTEPISEMNSVTKDMAGLDFGRKCRVDSQDEIGELGASINHLSDRLGEALSDLEARNQQLQEDIARERGLEQMRRQFVQNVSHELKTPICIILGYAEGLSLNVVNDQSKRQQYVRVINDEAKKMGQLVQSLLELSEYQSGHSALKCRQFDLRELTDSTLQHFQPLFSAQGVTVRRCFSGDSLVIGDDERIEQVISNYLSNAVSHASGEMLIRVSGVRRADNYRLTVFNSGLPIADGDLEQIWTSFYRADQVRSRQSGRYGLGLSIVRAIMELHHQPCGVANVPGGVEFWFELPRCE